MAAADEVDVRTVWGVLDACCRTAPLERQHSFLEFIRDGLNRRLEAIETEITRKRTPPPRKPSGSIRVDDAVGNAHPDKER